MTLALELGLLALIGLAGAFGAQYAADGVLQGATLHGLTGSARDAAGVTSAAHTAVLQWAASIAILIVARGIAARRRGTHIPTPLLLPSTAAAMALGLCVQLGYGNPYVASWPGPGFAAGVLAASVVGAGVLLMPLDPGEWVPRVRWPIAGGVLAIFLVMLVFGSAPGASDQRVNLVVGPLTVQPVEFAKLGAVLFIAVELGRRAPKLRYQRDRVSLLRLPRLRLLLPAIVALCGTLLGLLTVKDLGPTLILGGVVLALFYVVTRSPGWVALATGLGAAGLTALWLDPGLSLSHTVELRIRMWADPWLNGLQHGDQLAMSRWALAAGGFGGVGLGNAYPGALAAGHTDLVYAHLVEELGQAGGTLYLCMLAGVILSALHVGMRSRTPERAMMAAGVGFLLTFQTATILGGTLGVIPLTGVVVPFLSHGRTSMVAFVAAVALVGRLAQDGALRARIDEMRELSGGIREGGIGVGVLGVAAVMLTGVQAVVLRDRTTLQPAVTTLEEGQPRLFFDRRIRYVADSIRRGSILDRNGQPLAESPAPGQRVNPLGAQLGTLLGPADSRLLRASWSLERLEDEHLRGYPDAEDGPAIWLGHLPGGADRVLLAVPSARTQAPDEEARALAELTRLGGVAGLGGVPARVRRVALATPDLSGLLPIVRLPLAMQAEAIRNLSDDVAARSVTTTLDARLQGMVATAVRAAAEHSKVGVAAAVVIDPATGQVLARAQWPDYDPSTPPTPADTDWQDLRAANDPKFMGIYGPWADKTGSGDYGYFQAGSVFKPVTAVAAARAGLLHPTDAAACTGTADPVYTCGPSFTLPEWSKPIHNHGDGGGTGRVDLIDAMAESSNVYFGQLGLTLGPTAYRDLLTAGVRFGLPTLATEADGPYSGVGSAGSRRLALTAFGQGAAAWTVTQAAQFTAALADGGTYRACELRADRPCTSSSIVASPELLEPVLAGMRQVMRSGTGARLKPPPGVRVYGKTGTADAPGNADEAPYGVKPRAEGLPHAWFVAIAEPDTAPECASASAGRYVIAAVVPHSGFGATVAGPLAMQITADLQTLSYLP